MAKFLTLLCAAATVVGLSTADVISPSPEVTDWGTWAPDFERCPEGTAAKGFDLLVEDWSGPVDDTCLNGIRLYCGTPVDGTPTITSSIGHEGVWGEKFRCSLQGYVTGFALRVEKEALLQDETATNNVRIYCSNNNGEYIEGDGTTFGTWGAAVHCPSGQVVCGIRTQVHEDQGVIGDDTALNNVHMECCPMPAN